MKCIVKAFTVSKKVMLVLWSVKSECYYSKTIIKTQPASCFVFFSFFGPSLHCFEYHVCIYILVMCSSLECDLFARRDLWFVFNVESQQQQQKCSSTEQHVILGGGDTPHFACIWSLFIYREPYCLNPYQAFYVWLFKLLWLIISRDAASPRLCRYSPPPIWNPPPATLSTVRRHIYIFF